MFSENFQESVFFLEDKLVNEYRDLVQCEVYCSVAKEVGIKKSVYFDLEKWKKNSEQCISVQKQKQKQITEKGARGDLNRSWLWRECHAGKKTIVQL